MNPIDFVIHFVQWLNAIFSTEISFRVCAHWSLTTAKIQEKSCICQFVKCSVLYFFFFVIVFFIVYRSETAYSDNFFFGWRIHILITISAKLRSLSKWCIKVKHWQIRCVRVKEKESVLQFSGLLILTKRSKRRIW